MATFIRIANLEKTYNITNTIKQEVLKGINLNLESGEIVALLGESGCGKSTLINILGGLDTDYTGSVIFKGKFFRDFSEDEMDDFRKKEVGLIFQSYNLIPHMTIGENIEIALNMSAIDLNLRKERVQDLLKLVGLSNHQDKLPNQLSGGQQQRVSIARALANNPEIILADEPTGALDKESTDQIIDILKRIARSGKLVIIVTHSPKVADECTRIVKIEDGVVSSDIITSNVTKREYKKYVEDKPKSISTKNVFRLAKKNISNNKSRNALIAIGMSIGIAAFILILCLSQGLTNYVKDVYSADATALNISANYSYGINDTKLDKVYSIEGVSSVIESATIRTAYTYNESSSYINNLNAYYTNFTPDMLYGSISNEDGYIVINETLANNLSDGGIISSVGNKISLTYDDIVYEYIISGIYEDTSDLSSSSNAYISDNNLDQMTDSITTLYIKAKDITYIDSIISYLEVYGFTVSTANNSSSTVLEYIDLGTNVITAVSAISMAVSAIMIVIVAYISVIERTREIGIIRAIGGRKKDIRKMFLFESAMQGAIGGILGIIICLVISSITNFVCYLSLDYIFISYNVIYYLIGLSLSIVISTLAGIAPAYKASTLDPVEALRFE